MTLNITNNKNLRLKIKISLDKMNLIIERKLPSLEVIKDYEETVDVNLETNIEDVFNDFYKRYLDLKEIENFWKNELKDGETIEFKEFDNDLGIKFEDDTKN